MEGETDVEMNRVFFKTISRCLFDSCKALMDEYTSPASRRTAVVVAFEMFQGSQSVSVVGGELPPSR